MKIRSVHSWRQAVPLTRPYTIATRTISAVELFFLRVIGDDGTEGVGSASPSGAVTGETAAHTAAALSPDSLGWVVGEQIGQCDRLRRRAQAELAAVPAARAAVDMALYDLQARALGVPLCDLLGRCHSSLPTSITVGIKSAAEAVAEAREHLGRGFTHLKVKLGRSLPEDIERLRRLREALGRGVRIRVDANQGYTADQARHLGELLDELDIEFVEQPLPAAAVDETRSLPASLCRRLAADESLITPADAAALAAAPRPFGIYNVKLMKCGGPGAALGIAAIAAAAGIELMWGCNDESVVSIAAALHTAYACPATRHLDLDGSFDLAADPARGGFTVRDGRLVLTDAPGLGVRLRR